LIEVRILATGLLQDIDELIGIGPIDVFFCCSGFEDRSSILPVAVSKRLVERVYVACHQDYEEQSIPSMEKIKNAFRDNAKIFETNTSNPLLTADRLSELVQQTFVGAPKKVVIDITAFTREALVMFIRLLRNFKRKSDLCQLIYLGAREYSVGDPKPEKWLSKGIREVRSVLGFAGEIYPSRKNHLIILLGFEDQRALSLVRECEPSRISIGICDGSVSYTAPHQETNIECFTRLASFVKEAGAFVFDGYDPMSAASKIIELDRQYSDFNTIVAPMNTKISTVGAALAAIKQESIQLCYAQANIYNVERYSAVSDEVFIFELDFEAW
jgi:hypothetical protein